MFWTFVSLCSVLLPIIMILVGKYFMNHPPKEINMLCGYRTCRSMKNINTWIFANKYMGKIWAKFGNVMLILSIIPMLFVIEKDNDTIGITSLVVLILQFIVLFWTIYLTEKALQNNFDNDGNNKK